MINASKKLGLVMMSLIKIEVVDSSQYFLNAASLDILGLSKEIKERRASYAKTTRDACYYASTTHSLLVREVSMLMQGKFLLSTSMKYYLIKQTIADFSAKLMQEKVLAFYQNTIMEGVTKEFKLRKK